MMHQCTGHPCSFWQREANLALYTVAVTAVEDADLRGDDAAHSCASDENIFYKG